MAKKYMLQLCVSTAADGLKVRRAYGCDSQGARWAEDRALCVPLCVDGSSARPRVSLRAAALASLARERDAVFAADVPREDGQRGQTARAVGALCALQKSLSGATRTSSGILNAGPSPPSLTMAVKRFRAPDVADGGAVAACSGLDLNIDL